MISYIIVSYNTEPYTIQTIESLVRHCSNYEIIVVDNNSSDNTAYRIMNEYKNVRLIQTDKNLGFSKANNIGAKKAKGDFYVFLNPDTIVLNDLGNDLNNAYIEHFKEDNVILSPQIINPNYSPQHCKNLFPIINLLTPFKYIYKHYINHYPIQKTDWITGVSLSMSRKVFDLIGGWNEQYDLYSEDLDICYRLKKLGGACYVVKDINLIHYGNQSGKKVYKSDYASFEKKCNSLRIFFNLYYSDKMFYKYLSFRRHFLKDQNAKKYMLEYFGD